jgi:hypothetical protein
MTDIQKYSVSQQQERPSVPDQIEYVDGPFQCPIHQHSDLFHNVGLREKGCQTKKQSKRDDEPVVEQIIHAILNPLRRSFISTLSLIAHPVRWQNNPVAIRVPKESGIWSG